MDELILNRIYESVKQGKSVAMVVITEEIGSSPRKSGSMMAVWSDGETLGSVGGGMIEYTVTNLARVY
jgi:xanthine dehydrogenase accessory factor